jgi:glycosyltransferase involved in cell wall biosynthesis
MKRQGVSIIICCHNGASRLPVTIRHIAAQIVPKSIRWEFLLIDNGSSDDSARIAEVIWSMYNSSADFRIVEEPMLGLSHARAKGFEEARYEYVIMCDDDNWLANDYVTKTYHLMSEYPNIGALGGLGRLVYEITPPKWIEYAQIFAAGPQSSHNGKVESNRLYGAGCVIRKTAYTKLKEIGFNSFLTDRKGLQLSSGGDHELCYALSIMGFEIWYDDSLRFAHFITKDRLTWKYFMRYARESAICFDVLTSYKMVANDVSHYKFPYLVMARDFFFVLRKFFRISMLRWTVDEESAMGKLLYFKHVILQYKLMAYFRKFRAIVDNHKKIIEFKEACVEAKMIAPIQQHVRQPVRIFSSLGLFRLLQ